MDYKKHSDISTAVRLCCQIGLDAKSAEVFLASAVKVAPSTENKVLANCVCWEDLRRTESEKMDWFLTSFCRMAEILASLKGRKILNVIVDNKKNTDTESPEYNPFGVLTYLKVELEPLA